MDITPQWIEPDFLDRLYYLLVVPFAILASINTLVMLLFGVEAHYEMIYQISQIAIDLRAFISSTMLSVINGLSLVLFVVCSLVGSLPVSNRYWRYSETPAGRYEKYRQEKKKSDVIDLEPHQFTVN